MFWGVQPPPLGYSSDVSLNMKLSQDTFHFPPFLDTLDVGCKLGIKNYGEYRSSNCLFHTSFFPPGLKHLRIRKDFKVPGWMHFPTSLITLFYESWKKEIILNTFHKNLKVLEFPKGRISNVRVTEASKSFYFKDSRVDTCTDLHTIIIQNKTWNKINGTWTRQPGP